MHKIFSRMLSVLAFLISLALLLQGNVNAAIWFLEAAIFFKVDSWGII